MFPERLGHSTDPTRPQRGVWPGAPTSTDPPAATPSAPVPVKQSSSRDGWSSSEGRRSSSRLQQAVRAQEVSARVLQDLRPGSHLSDGEAGKYRSEANNPHGSVLPHSGPVPWPPSPRCGADGTSQVQGRDRGPGGSGHRNQDQTSLGEMPAQAFQLGL